MKDFHHLQEEKLLRAERLYTIVSQLHKLELQGNTEFVEKFLSSFPDHLKFMLSKVKEQETLCDNSDQCLGLLSMESSALQDLIRHAELVSSKKMPLDTVKAVGVLNLVRARKEFFKRLKKAA